MAKAWRMVRVPVELAGRLDAAAREMERTHSEGRPQLPPAYVEGVPLHHVIDRALSDWESHRDRGRRPRRRGGPGDSPARGRGMYTRPPQD